MAVAASATVPVQQNHKLTAMQVVASTSVTILLVLMVTVQLALAAFLICPAKTLQAMLVRHWVVHFTQVTTVQHGTAL